jgi:hypothetical protein
VCGLGLARQTLPRPLLFQASALQSKSVQEPRKAAISAPALGRVDPVTVNEPDMVREATPIIAESSSTLFADETAQEPSMESFWPLVRLEVTEAGLLLCLNVVLAVAASWLAGVGLARLYGELWHFLVPVHFAVSWTLEMVPITLVGQSPFMGSLGLLLDSAQPERRIAFSLFHLVSVALFPISFFCMVLTPYHRTLAEILTGQEILARPLPRMR